MNIHRPTRRPVALWLFTAAALAGCARQEARPVFTPAMTPGDRRALYEHARISVEVKDVGVTLPLLGFGPRVTYLRAGQPVAADLVGQRLQDYPESRANTKIDWGWVAEACGLYAAGVVGFAAISAPVFAFLPLGEVVSAAFSPHDPTATVREVDAYNRALAREAGVEAPPPLALPERGPAGEGWLGGNLCLELNTALGLVGHQDVDGWYQGTTNWNLPAFAISQVGGAADYAVADAVQVGIEYDPRIRKRFNVLYTSGRVDQWNLDAAGVLGRVRVLWPVSPSAALVLTVAAGAYNLSGAHLETNYWYGTQPFTGAGPGGYVSVGFERFYTRTSSLFAGAGYRTLRIDNVTGDPGVVWLGSGARGQFTSFDDSGLLLTIGWRFLWSARPAPVYATPAFPPAPAPVSPAVIAPAPAPSATALDASPAPAAGPRKP